LILQDKAVRSLREHAIILGIDYYGECLNSRALLVPKDLDVSYSDFPDVAEFFSPQSQHFEKISDS